MDPKRIGTLEPGRQTITLRDRVLGVPEAVALAAGAGAWCTCATAVSAVSEGAAGAALGLGICATAVLLASAGWFLRWYRLGPTVLVLREGGLTMTASRETRVLAFADIDHAFATRRAVHSELTVVLADGTSITVPIPGYFRADAMARAITEAMRASPTATATEDLGARRALDRLRGREPAS